MHLTKKNVVLASPFVIIAMNFIVAYIFGPIIGKWTFIPIILIEWCLFIFFISRIAGKDSILKWLKKPCGDFAWNMYAIFISLIPLPLFVFNYETLAFWHVWVPYALIALVNPWVEEFYWRGLLLDYTKDWSKWISILFSSSLFALNQAVFGLSSDLNNGYAVVVSAFMMGVVWAIVYQRTNSLRWVIFAHFLVDVFNLSAASFLDLYGRGGW